MKLIRKRSRQQLVPLTVRIARASAERYRHAREIAARHDAAVNLRAGVERLIDTLHAEALALEVDATRAATADAAAGAAAGDARGDADDDVPGNA